MRKITIDLPLEPEGKKAPEARIVKTRSGKQFISFYTTAQTRKYEAAVKEHARLAMRGMKPFDGPLTVVIDAIFPVPTSWSDVKWRRAVSGVIRPTVKPDWDNISKIIGDAFNEVVWVDDARVVDGRTRKFYGKTPCLTVTVRETEIGLLESEEDAA